MNDAMLEHQPLIDFLERESEIRRQTWAEMAEAMGLSSSQLYNIRNGKQPGLKVCRDIARYTGQNLDFVLFLAGHITETELRKSTGVPPRAERIMRALETLEDSSIYDPTVRALEVVLDTILYKLDAPE